MAPFYSKLTQVKTKGTVLTGNVLKFSSALDNRYYTEWAYL